MDFIRAFFRQKVPKNISETPRYYRQSLALCDQFLAGYFLLTLILITASAKHFFWIPALLLALVNIKYLHRASIPVRINLLAHVLIVLTWTFWYIHCFGWNYGGQHLLIVLILLVFFSLYEPPLVKVLYFLVILGFRMFLFSYVSAHAPMMVLDSTSHFILQLLNSLVLFLLLACFCIIYSSNLQDTERQLLLHNEQLQVQAETDPLTKLFNRRYLMAEMSRFVKEHPDAMYCVAIADIDFFKRINDTYGHNCGDYTLRRLAALFTEHSHGQYSISRWGGEEFCFFFPNTNIDDAGRIITDVCIAVRKMQLEYEGNSFSITLTAGVEENDYRSSLETLIESADRKLYRGKQNGRDQIVF